MKLIIRFTILLLTLNVALASCKKYLDKKQNTGVDIPDELNDLQALLDDALIMNTVVTPSMGEASADDYFVLQSVFDPRNQKDKDLYRWIPPEYFWENDWSKCYAPVYNANYCLEMLKEIDVTSNNQLLYNNVKGSALFLRSYYFLQLAWTYAKAYDDNTASSDLGIALRLGADFNIPSVRANVRETYERIISDAKESVNYLPNTPQHVFRPSKAAAYGLLARAYLSMRDYSNSLRYADSCLNLKSDLLNFNTEIDINASNPFSPPFNKEIIFFTSMNTTAALVVQSRALVDTLLYDSYMSSDLRKTAYFRPNMGYRRFKGSYTGDAIMFSGIATDEIYFIRAESYARQGKKDDALHDLNSVMKTRYDSTFTPFTASDALDALVIILNERRKELYWRGVRFSDLKRLNKEGYNITLSRLISGRTYTLPPNDNRYALPLPKDVIDQSGMPQNPQ